MKTGWVIKSNMDQSYVLSDTHCTYQIREAKVFTLEQAEQVQDSYPIEVELDKSGKPLRRVSGSTK